MGKSLTGRLYYGFPIDEDSEIDYFEYEDIWKDEHNPILDSKSDYLSKFQNYLKSVNNIEIGYSGYDAEEPFICIVNSIIYFTTTLEIPIEILTKEMSAEDQSIKKFCERFNIKYKQPKWNCSVSYI